MTMKLWPSILAPTFSASPLSSRLRASNWPFMISNLARLSFVARSALPCGRRKLRAKPSFTRTTSPIWPSLATRSSRMTSILVLLWGVGLRWSIGRYVSGCFASGASRGRGAAPGRAHAQAEQRLSDADQRHDHDRPDQEDDAPVGARQHDGATAHMTRSCVH